MKIRFKFWELYGWEDECIMEYPYLPFVGQTVFYKGRMYKVSEIPTIELDKMDEYCTSVHCKEF